MIKMGSVTAALDLQTPFGEPVEEIPLSSAPLVAVVAQVRFPPIVSITREEFIGPFQERIRADYPVLRQEREANIVLTQEGVSSAGQSNPIWRFLDRPTNPAWKVSLAPSFVALDTSEYESRIDFLRRLHAVIDALAATIAPSTYDRVGIRYVDRVRLDEIEMNLGALVKPEMLGVVTVNPGEGAELVHSVSDTSYRIGNATFHGRWGWLPSNAQLDPLHGETIASPSWILDLDMYTTQVSRFDVDQVISIGASFAEHIYRFFRWAVRPDLLRQYGGAV